MHYENGSNSDIKYVESPAGVEPAQYFMSANSIHYKHEKLIRLKRLAAVS